VTVLAEEDKVVVDSRAVVESKPFVVVGIPALDEEGTIARVILRAQAHAHRRKKNLQPTRIQPKNEVHRHRPRTLKH
jgi:hypothetical protein